MEKAICRITPDKQEVLVVQDFTVFMLVSHCILSPRIIFRIGNGILGGGVKACELGSLKRDKTLAELVPTCRFILTKLNGFEYYYGVVILFMVQKFLRRESVDKRLLRAFV